MRRLGMFQQPKPKNPYPPKPYEQMTYPGQRVQVDVKVVPRKCIADSELRLFQYTAIDEFIRLHFLAAYPEQSTYSSADFLKRLMNWYARKGTRVEYVQTDNGFEFTNRFLAAGKVPSRFLSRLPLRWTSGISGFAPIHLGITAKWSAVTMRTRNASIPAVPFTLSVTLSNSLLFITAISTTFL